MVTQHDDWMTTAAADSRFAHLGILLTRQPRYDPAPDTPGT
jgi:hypothetical protein